jgi:hypothetical protein
MITTKSSSALGSRPSLPTFSADHRSPQSWPHPVIPLLGIAVLPALEISVLVSTASSSLWCTNTFSATNSDRAATMYLRRISDGSESRQVQYSPLILDQIPRLAHDRVLRNSSASLEYTSPRLDCKPGRETTPLLTPRTHRTATPGGTVSYLSMSSRRGMSWERGLGSEDGVEPSRAERGEENSWRRLWSSAAGRSSARSACLPGESTRGEKAREGRKRERGESARGVKARQVIMHGSLNQESVRRERLLEESRTSEAVICHQTK